MGIPSNKRWFPLKRIYNLQHFWQHNMTFTTSHPTIFGGWFLKISFLKESYLEIVRKNQPGCNRTGSSSGNSPFLPSSTTREKALAAAAPKMFLGRFAGDLGELGGGWKGGWSFDPLGKKIQRIFRNRWMDSNSEVRIPNMEIHGNPYSKEMDKILEGCFAGGRKKRGLSLSWGDSLECEA